jgi:hypothetical protein
LTCAQRQSEAAEREAPGDFKAGFLHRKQPLLGARGNLLAIVKALPVPVRTRDKPLLATADSALNRAALDLSQKPVRPTL